MSTDVCDLNLGEVSDKLAAGELSSRAVTDACLERIAALDDELGAFLLVDETGARAAADASDARRAKGNAIGPLDGVPIGLKDNLVTEGVVTTAASRILEGWVPPYDATVVRKLKAAGAVLVGKLNCDEFAMGSSNENSAYRVCRNPWDRTLSPGGSSGGAAAAVASGMCFGALGTDTGGSIRQPAAFCGVAGLKPSYGRVSRFGAVAFASSLDQIGPFARDVRGCALLLEAIAGVDERDSTSVDAPVEAYADLASKAGKQALAGLRVGVPAEMSDVGGEGLAPEVKAGLDRARAALIEAGAELVAVSLPHTKYAVATYYIVATAEASSNLSRYDGVRYGPRDGENDGLQALYTNTRGDRFGAEVKRRILLGTYVLSAGYYDAYYLRAQKVRARIAEDFASAFAQADVLLTPTSPTPAFALGSRTEDPLQMYLSDVFTISANLAGLCGISLDGAAPDDRLPVGLQLLAAPFDEGRLLTAAAGLEAALGARDRRPGR